MVGEINVLVGRLARRHDVRRDEIITAVVAGNTTMIHLFLGLPPAEIRREPYIPVATAPPVLHAEPARAARSTRGRPSTRCPASAS